MLTAKIKHSMFSVASPNKLLFHTHLMSDSASVRTQLQNPAENTHFTVWLWQQLDPPQHLLLPHSQRKDKSGGITRAVRSRPGSGMPHFCLRPLAELGHLATANYTEAEKYLSVFSDEKIICFDAHILLILSYHLFIFSFQWNTFLAAAAAAKSLQSCPTLCDPIDGSPPGSPVPGILQARTLECVAVSFSNAWKWKVKVKSLSHVQLLATPWTAAHQAPPSMGFSRQEYWNGVPSPSLTLSLADT